MPLPYVQLAHWFERNANNASLGNIEEHEPMYMYHVSNVPLSDSDSVKLRPKFIRSSEWEIDSIRRICVAPTIEQCLIAIAPNTSNEAFYVYRTHTKVSKSVPPFGVYDAPLSQERWLRSERRFNLIATIPRYSADDVANASDGIRENATNRYVGLNFNGRGGWGSFDSQWNELRRLKRFLKEHDHQYFVNDVEKRIHDNQRSMKSTLNRIKTVANRKTK